MYNVLATPGQYLNKIFIFYSCDVGYYGDPLVIGGSCKPCQCNVGGAIDNNCDPVSGHCHCYPGITGLKCDKCLPRHVVVGTRCMCKYSHLVNAR